MKLWQLYLAIAVTNFAIVLLTYGALKAGKEQGRHEAIERYRAECLAADKKHERQFTLLYVDEYRVSNCDEAVRCVWGDCVEDP